MAKQDITFGLARLGALPSQANLDLITRPILESVKPYFHSFLQVDMAHTVMLSEQGIITPFQAGSILKLLQEIDVLGPERFQIDPQVGSFLIHVEKYMIDRIGEDVAGRMHTGRSRNDQSTAVDRLYVRDRLLSVLEALLALQETILTLARDHTRTLMPGYTHLQHAQPTTFGHHLMRYYFVLERDQQRIKGAFQRTNMSALGGAAMAGTSWPLNRERTAELLGHEQLVENSFDTGIFARDYPAENAAVLSILTSNVGQLAGDLYVWSTWEFGMVEIADDLAGTSSIMPQKKNPHSLERIRGLSGSAIGWLPSVLGTLRSASSSDLDLYFAPDPTEQFLTATLSALALMRITLQTLTVKKDVMSQRAGIFWSTASNLADEIVRNCGLSFRTAHHVVGRLVRNSLEQGIGPLDVTANMVDQAAQESIGRSLGLSNELVQKALDPQAFLSTRVTEGSPNPGAVENMIKEGEHRQAIHRKWHTQTSKQIEDSHQLLCMEINRYITMIEPDRSSS
jgi:argininosuccinate lyase